jgi:hypothetical protein
MLVWKGKEEKADKEGGVMGRCNSHFNIESPICQIERGTDREQEQQVPRGKRDIKEGTYELRRLENVLTTGVITLEVRSFLGWILWGNWFIAFALEV